MAFHMLKCIDKLLTKLEFTTVRSISEGTKFHVSIKYTTNFSDGCWRFVILQWQTLICWIIVRTRQNCLYTQKNRIQRVYSAFNGAANIQKMKRSIKAPHKNRTNSCSGCTMMTTAPVTQTNNQTYGANASNFLMHCSIDARAEQTQKF